MLPSALILDGVDGVTEQERRDARTIEIATRGLLGCIVAVGPAAALWLAGLAAGAHGGVYSQLIRAVFIVSAMFGTFLVVRRLARSRHQGL